VGVRLICAGLVPIVSSFVEFFRAEGTPIPVASPPRLVVTGFYRYVRNPIYAGFLAVLLGEALLFGSLGLLRYTLTAWCVGAAAALVRRTQAHPQIRSRIPGLPARRASVAAPSASLDARRPRT
jgi:protein-S-isoprenylcysteine O-methyltransferase Ste14